MSYLSRVYPSLCQICRDIIHLEYNQGNMINLNQGNIMWQTLHFRIFIKQMDKFIFLFLCQIEYNYVLQFDLNSLEKNGFKHDKIIRKWIQKFVWEIIYIYNIYIMQFLSQIQIHIIFIKSERSERNSY